MFALAIAQAAPDDRDTNTCQSRSPRSRVARLFPPSGTREGAVAGRIVTADIWEQKKNDYNPLRPEIDQPAALTQTCKPEQNANSLVASLTVSASVPYITALRETLLTISGAGPRERPVQAFGIDMLDDRLADRGLRLDALHEVAGRGDQWGDEAAATLFLAGIVARAKGPVLWVLRSHDLFAPALYQAGLTPERVLYAEARDDGELLALMEEGLRHRGLAAVIGEPRRVAMAQTRRLQLVAEGGRTIALLLKRAARGGGDPFGIPSAAVTRWCVASAPSMPVPWEGLGRACWQLSCVRQRGGDPFELLVEAPNETGCLALPARLVDRPVEADRAPLRAVG